MDGMEGGSSAGKMGSKKERVRWIARVKEKEVTELP